MHDHNYAMKIRKIIITVILLLLLGLLFMVGSISYQSGVSYGESNAEEIRASKINVNGQFRCLSHIDNMLQLIPSGAFVKV